MKKKKIKLTDLEVDSFITTTNEEAQTIEGGSTIICGATGFITTQIVASVAFGGCPTKGAGIFCEEGQTWACGSPDLPAMSLEGGGGNNCHEFSDNCPRSIGGAGCTI